MRDGQNGAILTIMRWRTQTCIGAISVKSTGGKGKIEYDGKEDIGGTYT